MKPTTILRGWSLVIASGLVAALCGCGGSSTSATQQQQSGPPSAVPFLNQPLVPDTAAPGGAGFTLTVTGSGFVSDSVVNWNGSARTTTFVNNSKLTASISASDIATAATASVTVVNPRPGGGSSNVAFFPVATPNGSVALSGSPFSAGGGPMSVAAGDFNGDGKLDLIVADTVTGNVGILLGNGDGTFQAGANYAVGTVSSDQFFQVAMGDLNGDGKLDFVVSDNYDNNVSVFLGKGDGTFQAAVTYNAGTNPTSVAVADVNGDGKLDLIVSNQNCAGGPPCATGTISILLGNGDGTFAAHVDYDSGIGPNWVTVGDFNGDGKLDLAVANGQGCPGGGCQSGFSILLGNGDGTFQAASTYHGGINPDTIATADLNGDGKLDLVLLDNGGLVWIIPGNGDGTFQTSSALGYWTDGHGGLPWGSIGIGDFNGDGKLDVAVASAGATDADLFLGNGDGTFQSPLLFNTGSSQRGVFVADFNQDGRLDIAVANYGDNTITALLQ